MSFPPPPQQPVPDRALHLIYIDVDIHTHTFLCWFFFFLFYVCVGRNLAIGIGIQNFPEGLAVSLPLRGAGFSTWKAFW